MGTQTSDEAILAILGRIVEGVTIAVAIDDSCELGCGLGCELGCELGSSLRVTSGVGLPVSKVNPPMMLVAD
jgi:hypothetical protein